MDKPRPASNTKQFGDFKRQLSAMGSSLNDPEDEADNSMEVRHLKRPDGSSSPKEDKNVRMIKPIGGDQSLGSDDDDEASEDDDDDDEHNPPVEGVYNAGDYEHLKVSEEIKELFKHITRYTTQTIELEYKLKPFIPDFIPAVGDIDAFLKVVRPDDKSETIGLTVIDEPSAKQSDPTVLDLQLRAISKEAAPKSVAVKMLSDPETNAKEIDGWIKSISDLHRSKPPPAVHYSRNMPNIDTLMQEWDPEFETLLKEVKFPTADLECDLDQYVDIVCGLLDIPIYKSRIQSLHLLFSLFLAFKKHQHFRSHLQQSSGNTDFASNNVDQLFL